MPRILLVEDNTNARVAYTIALKRFGYEVQPAEDGQVALELFHPKEVDLVVTDYKMPRLDGDRLVLQLHRLQPDLPVLVISAFETKDLRDKVSNESRLYFLAKPFTTVQLKSTIDRILHEK